MKGKKVASLNYDLPKFVDAIPQLLRQHDVIVLFIVMCVFFEGARERTFGATAVISAVRAKISDKLAV